MKHIKVLLLTFIMSLALSSSAYAMENAFNTGRVAKCGTDQQVKDILTDSGFKAILIGNFSPNKLFNNQTEAMQVIEYNDKTKQFASVEIDIWAKTACIIYIATDASSPYVFVRKAEKEAN